MSTHDPFPSAPSSEAPAARRSRGVGRLVAAGLGGLVLTLAGLVWDAVAHHRDPSLAGREGTFLTASAPHVLVALGLAVTGVALAGAAAALLRPARRRMVATLVVAAAAMAAVGGGALAMADGDHGHAPRAAGQAHDHDAHMEEPMRGGRGGGHHNVGVTQGEPTPEQQAAAAKLIEDTRAGTARLRDIRVAFDEGYRRNPTADPAAPMAHYANPAYAQDDVILDPTRPESLVFSDPDPSRAGDEVLLGVVYKTPPGVDGPQPGGPLTVWHTHAGACRQDPRSEACAQAPEMLHVWLEDGLANPFAISYWAARGGQGRGTSEPRRGG